MTRGSMNFLPSRSRWWNWIWLCALVLAVSGCHPTSPAMDLPSWEGDCQRPTAQEPVVPSLRALHDQTQRPVPFAAQASPSLTVAPAPFADLHALRVATDRALNAIPSRMSVPLDHQLDDVSPFWVFNTRKGEYRETEARLVFKSDVSYAWVETGTEADENYIRKLMAQFDERVYDATREVFGPVLSAGFDRDARIHVLFAQDLGAVLGYFHGAVGGSRLTYPYANEKDMLFLNLDFIGDLKQDLSLLGHEFQHLIHWHHDPGERGFINEGFSELAAPLVMGARPYHLHGFDLYRRNPELQLNDWASDSALSESFYGAGLGFSAYLVENFGVDFLRQVVSEPHSGIEGLNAIWQRQECDFRFDDVFADFALANIVWQPTWMGPTGRLGYASLFASLEPTHQRFLPQVRELTMDRTIQDGLPPYATRYLVFRGDGPSQTLALNFQGEAAAALGPLSAADGAHPLIWSNRHNGRDARLSRTFDAGAVAPDQAFALRTRMWWDIEEGWDYGYILASRDGQTWDILISEATVVDNPTGANLGAGLTGRSVADTDAEPWRTDVWDLSPYAGDRLTLRFDYVTDGALTETGWLIDELAIDALGYREDFEGALEDWTVEGWVPFHEPRPVLWLVQAFMVDPDGEVDRIQRWLANGTGTLRQILAGPGPDETLFLVVSPLVAQVDTRVEYEIHLREAAAE